MVIHRDENGKIIGSLSLLIRKIPVFPVSIMYSPRGPVCDIDDNDTLKCLLDGAKMVAKRYNSYVLKLDPDIKSDNEKFKTCLKDLGFKIFDNILGFEAIQPRYVFRLHIDGRTEEEILSSFHSKTRYNIRVAIKNGVEVRQCSVEDIDLFYSIMIETGTRDEFVIRSKEYFIRLLNSLGVSARLYIVFYQDKAVAGSIAIHYGDKVWYLYGASSNKYRNVMPNYLMQWEMIKWAIQENCRIYDFRGVVGHIDENHPQYGIYRFKKGFNGEFTEFIGSVEYIFKPFLYTVLEKAQRTFRTIRKKLFVRKHKESQTTSVTSIVSEKGND